MSNSMQIRPGERPNAAAATRNGFTLVELLVVIGIIAVLISILLPTLSRVRQQARNIKCAANLRQLGASFHIYAASNKGRYPIGLPGSRYPMGGFQSNIGATAVAGPTVPDLVTYAKLVASGVVKSPNMFYCPVADGNYDGVGNAAAFVYNFREPSWKAAIAEPDYNAWANLFAGYLSWVRYTDTSYGAPVPTAAGHAFYKNDLKQFKALCAQDASSKSTTILASDMMLWQPGIGFPIKNNHWDGKDHYIKGPGGASKLIKSNGGYLLYNDGHVEWKRVEDTEWRMTHSTNTIEFYF